LWNNLANDDKPPSQGEGFRWGRARNWGPLQGRSDRCPLQNVLQLNSVVTALPDGTLVLRPASGTCRAVPGGPPGGRTSRLPCRPDGRQLGADPRVRPRCSMGDRRGGVEAGPSHSHRFPPSGAPEGARLFFPTPVPAGKLHSLQPTVLACQVRGHDSAGSHAHQCACAACRQPRRGGPRHLYLFAGGATYQRTAGEIS
jgi:hypothetical protein